MAFKDYFKLKNSYRKHSNFILLIFQSKIVYTIFGVSEENFPYKSLFKKIKTIYTAFSLISQAKHLGIL